MVFNVGCRVQGVGCRMLGVGCRVSGSGLGVHSEVYAIQDSGNEGFTWFKGSDGFRASGGRAFKAARPPTLGMRFPISSAMASRHSSSSSLLSVRKGMSSLRVRSAPRAEAIVVRRRIELSRSCTFSFFVARARGREEKGGGDGPEGAGVRQGVGEGCVWGRGCRTRGSGFKVKGLGLRVNVSEFRVQVNGSGLSAETPALAAGFVCASPS